jgi:hypothetical protein
MSEKELPQQTIVLRGQTFREEPWRSSKKTGRSRESQTWALSNLSAKPGSLDLNIFPAVINIRRVTAVPNTPEGYPLPRSAVHSWFDAMEMLAVTFSSKTQPSKQASRVTLAATLAAPTILNFESALEHTVKLIPGNSLDKYASYVVVVPNAST